MGRLERLTKYRISQGYTTAKEFAEFLGVSASQISEIDKKKNPSSLLLALKSKTNLNLIWLETGKGEMTVTGGIEAGDASNDPGGKDWEVAPSFTLGPSLEDQLAYREWQTLSPDQKLEAIRLLRKLKAND